MGVKSKLGILPDLLNSTLSFSSFPTGTSLWGIFGIFDKIFSKSSFTDFCFLDIDSMLLEISFDLANNVLSLDLEISFFSFSKFSFF